MTTGVGEEPRLGGAKAKQRILMQPDTRLHQAEPRVWKDTWCCDKKKRRRQRNKGRMDGWMDGWMKKSCEVEQVSLGEWFVVHTEVIKLFWVM